MGFWVASPESLESTWTRQLEHLCVALPVRGGTFPSYSASEVTAQAKLQRTKRPKTYLKRSYTPYELLPVPKTPQNTLKGTKTPVTPCAVTSLAL